MRGVVMRHVKRQGGVRVGLFSGLCDEGRRECVCHVGRNERNAVSMARTHVFVRRWAYLEGVVFLEMGEQGMTVAGAGVGVV